MSHNYPTETKWEDTKTQVKRREARNRARYKSNKKGKTHKGDGKELDHVGYHPTGSLSNVKTRVVSRHKNRSRQPPHKGYKSK